MTSACEELCTVLDDLDARTDGMEDVWGDRRVALGRLVDDAGAAGCADLAKTMRWEAMLAYAYASNVALPHSDRPRFTEFHPDLVRDDALDYLMTRTTSSSAYVRSRAMDFLWLHGGASRKRVAVGAGAVYLEVATLEAGKVSAENFGWLRVGDAVVRAAQLAKAANQRGTIRAVADRALQLLQQFRTDGVVRHVLDMALALIEVCNVLTFAEHGLVDSALADTATDFLMVGDYHLNREAIMMRRRFAAACRQPNAVLHDLDVDVARSCMQEGEQRELEGAHLVASIAYNQALHQLEDVGGEKHLIEAARAALRRTRQAGMGEMVRITTGPVQLSPEHQAHVDGVIATVSSAPAPQCFQLLAVHPALLVSRTEAEESVRTAQQVAPLSHLFPRVVLRDAGQALAPHDPAEVARLDLFQLGVQLLRIQDTLMLDPILLRLVERPDLGPEALIGYFADSGHIPARNMPVIERGIRRLWERDWISALHILAPQLEDVLRELLRRAGRDTMRTHQSIAGVTVEVPLAYILDQLADVIVDDGVIFMLNLVFDLYGLNLRNLVGHGLVDVGDCDIDTVARILQIYLIICGLRPAAESAPSSDEGADRTTSVG